MIKQLRIKFVCVVMAIVTVMLVGILGVIIHFTGESMRMQSLNMMRAVAGAPRWSEMPDKPTGEVRLPFFTVQVSRQGELLAKSGGYFDLSDEEYLLEIVRAALESPEETGELEEYRLRFLKDKSPMGYTIVFADTATSQATLGNMGYVSLLIFVVAELVFLGISILLSHWAVRPVETAWNQQRQFVADASHELKTPLSVIMANAELLQNEDSEEERKRFSKNILSMTYQMRSLVENMLEMARVDNGAGKVQFSQVDFSELVEDAVLSFQLLYEEKDMNLESSVAERIRLHGSEQQLYQVMDVLLDNGLKYASGTVRVSLSQNGRTCLLKVSSPGQQISKEDLKQIFKRFYRIDKARAMDGGYGLGLSIAEAIVHSHRGKIWAESRDGINTFFVQLPVRE